MRFIQDRQGRFAALSRRKVASAAIVKNALVRSSPNRRDQSAAPLPWFLPFVGHFLGFWHSG
jgi:hypothetical protein